MPRPDDLDGQVSGPATGDDTAGAGTPVVVRRNAGLAALVGAGASAIAIAYLWRATQSAAPLDWALCLVMGVIAALYLANLVDARTPLLVADDLGVRIRLGSQWRGLPWDAVERVVVQPRRGLLGDGRLKFGPHSLSRALDGLDPRGRRAAALNQKMYGAALAVPMGLTTRVSAQDQELADRLAALAHGHVDVQVATTDSAGAGPSRRSLLGGIGTVVSRVAKGRSHDVDTEHPQQVDEPVVDEPVAPPAVPARETRPGLRAQVTRDTPATVLGNVAAPHPEGRELRRPGSVDLEFEAAPSASVFESSRVRPISTLGEPVDALVIDDFVTEPAYDPVIGPELAAARVRVGLSVDELADRTRIRPHVIESVEVDDFAPCGGDFYARGHLRTLARVLGKDPAPLLEHFDNRYATAPINARRVFEAELATGMTGSMRSTVGGPNWALLVGVVLVLVLTWGLVRLFASEPPGLLLGPAPTLSGSGPVRAPAPAPARKPIRLTLVGAQAGSEVVVRNGSGEVVWAGEIVPGEKRTVKAAPPVRVKARDAGALEARVNGQDRGSLGRLGEPGRRTFHRPTPR